MMDEKLITANYIDGTELAQAQKITLAAAEHIIREFGTNKRSANSAARKLKFGNLVAGELPMPDRRWKQRRFRSAD